MSTGFFIVLEGIDKCGKSTQARLLAERWKRRGLRPVLTREPGGTALGERIRDLLLDQKHRVSPRAELLLYEASRAQHVQDLVAPALSQGRLVLSDRFSLSTFAYQGLGRGLSLPALRQIDRFAAFGLRPDLTVILDIPVEISLARIGGRRDRMETASLLRRVRRAYQRLAQAPGRRLIRADQPIDQLQDQLAQLIEQHSRFKALKVTTHLRHSRAGGNPVRKYRDALDARFRGHDDRSSYH